MQSGQTQLYAVCIFWRRVCERGHVHVFCHDQDCHSGLVVKASTSRAKGQVIKSGVSHTSDLPVYLF